MVEGKISVIMGIYNCAATLPEAIDSILGQTYQKWELILCDDCSTDNTYEVAEAYRERFPDKITLIRNETNRRLAASLNHCLEYADGEYVARMDGDDISLPERFAKQIAYLREHPEVDLVGTLMQQFNDSSRGAVVPKTEHPDRYSLRRIVPFHHATIMTYKRVYDTLGGYTVAERTARCEDYDLWFRFFEAGLRGATMQEVLYLVREDEKAIRRRTFRTRWNAFQTTRYGFGLLRYPKTWLVRPFVSMLVKSMVPARLMLLIRKWQGRKNG